MKKFFFSLEKVMDVKEIEKKIIQRELFNLENELSLAMDELKKNTKKYSDELLYKDKIMKNLVSSNDLINEEKYLISLKNDIDMSNETIEKIKRKIVKVKNNLAEKAKEKKALEILRENRLEDFKKKVKKNDQNVLDEVTARMRVRGYD